MIPQINFWFLWTHDSTIYGNNNVSNLFPIGGRIWDEFNVSSVCMIHAQVLNSFLKNILSSSLAVWWSIFRETLSCIGIQHGIWESMIKPLVFGVDTGISFGLFSKM